MMMWFITYRNECDSNTMGEIYRERNVGREGVQSMWWGERDRKRERGRGRERERERVEEKEREREKSKTEKENKRREREWKTHYCAEEVTVGR